MTIKKENKTKHPAGTEVYQAKLGYVTIAMKLEGWDIQECLEETTPIISTDATETQDLEFSVINSDRSLTQYFLAFSHI